MFNTKGLPVFPQEGVGRASGSIVVTMDSHIIIHAVNEKLLQPAIKKSLVKVLPLAMEINYITYCILLVLP